MGLTVTVLGCSGSYPGPGAACSGYLVRTPATTVWLDAGSGTMANLQRHVALHDVDAVVLTHQHPDHWTDLEGFHVACRYGEPSRSGVPVYAPTGLEEETHAENEGVFDWRRVADGHEAEFDGLRLRFSQTDHSVETLAVRIDAEGRTFAYSADTGPGWSLTELGDGIDLALCEASWPRQFEGRAQHLSGRQAGEMARAAAAGRLVVTHFWPTFDRDQIRAEAEEAFGEPVTAAGEGEEYEV